MSLLSRSAQLVPQTALGHTGWLRSAVGAVLGIACAAVATRLLLGGQGAAMPWIVAPMGASAVLVFAVPASPLAQPWAVIGGNVISALVGLGAGMITHSPALAVSLAVGTAIAAMSIARCLHPPGGACALLCALGATGPDAWGLVYIVPITANVLLLAASGWLYNNATGHDWPHHLTVPEPGDEPALAAEFARDDVAEVLDHWDEVLDVDVDDLHAFLQAVDRHRAKRLQAQPKTG